ncbi:glycerophosphodiester phosphodiesterase family protein [Sphingobacterium lactis]|uniref:Glycerophosphoryl diester phosphodiesterase n=1 Tax=Sphingobacterium lactis TaxID=797291 RepID=A0A1H5VK73_9SPHI|nr:glycerophosphodiester phosphodiesterase family protein [Sphingobacterium lactis]SEF87416.1 glycerophosphoryl diester phosphodiesterase [Sphingobacterium lactis]
MKIVKIILLLISSVSLHMHSYAQDTVIYAHRGFRGLMPENSIPAMKNALHHGADILEMDIAITKDKQAVISHDPWLDPLITLDAQGSAITNTKDKPIQDYTYAEIKSFDVGSKQHPDFPKQQNFPTYIPRLADLIDSVEHYVQEKGLPKPWYSIETKTSPKRDHKVTPAPEEFVRILMDVVISKGIGDRVIIQSFDERTLEIVHSKFPKVKTMLNVSKGTLEENLARLTFKLDYYAPIPALIDAALVQQCAEKGIKLLCGNTNNKAEIDRVLKLGVKEYCTDYPYADLP